MATFLSAMKLGVAFAAAPLSTLAPAAAVEQSITNTMRPVAVQKAEMGCGLAALSNLLNWSGLETSEEALTAILFEHIYNQDPASIARYQQNGASPRELAALVTALNAGLTPDLGILTIEEAKTLAANESFVVYLVDGAAKGQLRTHFTVIAGFDPEQGWLRADSIDGKHVRQRDQDFQQSALVQRDSTRMLVLRLRRGMAAAANPERASLLNTQTIPWIDSARLLAGLERSDAVYLTVSFSLARERLGSRDENIRGKSQSSVASLSVPLGNEFVAGVSLPYSRGSGIFTAREFGKISLGRHSGIGPLGLSLSKSVGSSKSGIDFAVGGDAGFGGGNLLSSWGLSGSMSKAVGDKTLLHGGLSASGFRNEKRWDLAIAPSMGLIRQVGKATRLQLGLSADVPLRSNSSSFRLYLGGGIERQLGANLAIGASATWSALAPAGVRSKAFSLSMTRRF